MRRAHAAVALLAAVGVAACSLIFSVDRFEGDPSRGQDAAANEGGRDAMLSDATVVDAPVSDAWCARDAAFCEDFDLLDAAPWSRWSSPPSDVNGALSLDVAEVRSEPYALLVSTNANASATKTNVYLSKAFTSASTEVHLAFDVRIDAIAPAEPVHILELKLRDANGKNRYEAYLIASSTDTRIYELDTPAATEVPDSSINGLLRALPVGGAWTRVSIDLVFADRLPEKPVLRIRFDEASPPVYEAAPWGVPKDDLFVLASFGVLGSSPKGAVTLHFDNITIDPR